MALISAIGAVIVAIAGGVGTFLVASFNAGKTRILEETKLSAQEKLADFNAERTRILEEMKLSAQEKLAKEQQSFSAAQGEADRILQSTQHDARIALQMEELKQKAKISDYEAYMAAVRLTHERDLAQANLVHTFFDKLLSGITTERDLALFAISAFVDPQRIARLAAGGEAVVSRESLSRLAARGDKDVAAVAQEVLNASAAVVQRKLLRVYKKGSAVMAANGFVGDGGLIVTYPVVQKGGTLEVQSGPNGEKVEAECIDIDDAHFLAVAKPRKDLNEAPLLLREKPIERTGTKIRVVQWSGDRFVVRAGEVVEVNIKQEVYDSTPTKPPPYALLASRQVVDALSLRVLSEPGSAGAPVLDEEGRVAGVIFGGDLGEESSLAAPASKIHALLASVRVAAGATAAAPAAEARQ